jgi:hypothetical protein
MHHWKNPPPLPNFQPIWMMLTLYNMTRDLRPHRPRYRPSGLSEYFQNSSSHYPRPRTPYLFPCESFYFPTTSPYPFPPVFLFPSPPPRTHYRRLELGYITYDQACCISFLDDSDGGRSYTCCHDFVKVAVLVEMEFWSFHQCLLPPFQVSSDLLPSELSHRYHISLLLRYPSIHGTQATR